MKIGLFRLSFFLGLGRGEIVKCDDMTKTWRCSTYVNYFKNVQVATKLVWIIKVMFIVKSCLVSRRPLVDILTHSGCACLTSVPLESKNNRL